MPKILVTMGSLLFIHMNAFAFTDAQQLPPCPNGAQLTGGYAPSPWPTCSAIFGSVFIDCMNQGRSEEECREEMQAAADANDRHSQCLWQEICAVKIPGSNKVVTKIERINAESACR